MSRFRRPRTQVELQPAGVSGGAGGAGGGAAARSLAARAAASASAAGDSGGALVERPAVMGDIRAFYNQCFLPAMEGEGMAEQKQDR